MTFTLVFWPLGLPSIQLDSLWYHYTVYTNIRVRLLEQTPSYLLELQNECYMYHIWAHKTYITCASNLMLVLVDIMPYMWQMGSIRVHLSHVHEAKISAVKTRVNYFKCARYRCFFVLLIVTMSSNIYNIFFYVQNLLQLLYRC